MNKICSKCKNEKPVIEFYKSKTGSLGFHAYCKKCCVEHKQEKTRLYRKSGYTVVSEKICTVCGATKGFAEYNRKSSSPDGLASNCKSCHSRVNKDLTNRNKETNLANGFQVVEFKTCCRCKILKPPSEFSQNILSKLGLQNDCRDCQAEKARNRKAKIRENNLTNGITCPETKTCWSCKEIKNPSEYRINYAEKDGLQRSCKDCQSNLNKDYRSRNKGLVVIWAANRRARILGLPNNFTKEDSEYALVYFDNKCSVCQEGFGKCHLDHWIPISDQTSDNPGTVPENIVPLCSRCNQSKNDSVAEDWLRRKYSEETCFKIAERITIYFNHLKIKA